MPDNLHLPEDDAALYVLGGLSAGERREFEARLAQSEELRALVRDLEEGTVAFALASPVKRAPQQIWERIEQAVAEESKEDKAVPASWLGWWRNGWAAAAACLAGWLLYALWVHRPGPPVAATTSVADFHEKTAATPPDSSLRNTKDTAQQKSPDTNATHQLLEDRVREAGALRAHVSALEDQVLHLSQTLTQQQALLNESNRIKFVQLTPASGVSGIAARLSPEAQRALFLAMARELGWLPTNMISGTEGSVGTNDLRVDFVDLRSATNRVTPPLRPQPDMQARASGNAPEPTSPLAAPANGIPAIVSSDHTVVAVDSTIAPSGSQLTFTGTGGQEPLGTVTMGDNALVVTVPFLAPSANGENGLSLTVASGAGVSNVFQLPAPGPVPP